jgi:4-amino-4-deoxy-L-arabinose transferase-like glycosyltransferase
MKTPPFVPPATPGWGRDLLLLALCFGALNFFLLGRLPLANPDESRYGEIPREMLARGDWVTPYLNGVPYFEKPPLVYWTVGLSRLVFGPADWAARLTPALFGLGGILLTYAAARRLHDRVAGLASAVVLGTSLIYFALSRILLLDMAVSVLMAATLFCFILGVQEPPGPRRRWLFLGLYASAALATLAKGLIGLALPGAVMFLWLLVFNQWRRLLPMHLPAGVALFLVIAAPWHLLAAQRNPGWAEFYFIHEHWTRFTTTAHSRYEPFWFFVPILLLGLFPWVGFLGSALRESLAGGWARRKENGVAWFLVTWVLFILLFFSKSKSKLIPYILPVFPALAVLVGSWMARRWAERGAAFKRAELNVFAFLSGLLGAAVLVVVLQPGLIRNTEQAEAVRPYGLVLGAVLLSGGILAPWLARLRGALWGFATIVVTIVAFYVGLLFAAPALQRPSTRELALVARDRVQPGEAVFHYWAFFHDFVYYSGLPVGLVSHTDELEVQFLDPAERAARFVDEAGLRRRWSGPERVWLLVRKSDLGHPQAVFADPAFRTHVIAETKAIVLLSNRP